VLLKCCSNITIDAIVLRLKSWPTVRVAQILPLMPSY
jgi:hypothetical protein